MARARTKTAPTILAVDIGNTNIVLGVVRGTRCDAQWRLASDTRRPGDEYAVLLGGLLSAVGADPVDWDGVVLGSVVPALTEVVASAIETVTGHCPMCLTHRHKYPVRNKYERPHEVGIDRLANASAGVLLLGKPLIVVDLGTAVTLDVVTASGDYVGGAILPGMEMSVNALARGTAKLPATAPGESPAIIGRTTADSIRSGVLNGLVGAVDHLVREMWRELGMKTPVLATGGLAGLLIGRSALVKKQDPNLTLVGLAQIWLINRRK